MLSQSGIGCAGVSINFFVERRVKREVRKVRFRNKVVPTPGLPSCGGRPRVGTRCGSM